jgi:hypothetical protein
MQFIEENSHMEVSPSGPPDADRKAKCPHCRSQHSSAEPCDKFMNELEIRIMLDQLKSIPPASSSLNNIKVAETYLRDKLLKISAARKASQAA